MTEKSRQEIIEAIYQVVLERKSSGTGQSYVASLYAKGLDKILGKIGEEATEVAIAGKGGETDQVIHEIADLWFHSLVLLGWYELSPERVFIELERRFGVSGLDEKAARNNKPA
jgi:phosphoribosyl-ATP pyrophosphohydrolase